MFDQTKDPNSKQKLILHEMYSYTLNWIGFQVPKRAHIEKYIAFSLIKVVSNDS